MQQKDQLICPGCRVEMNHHAMKIDRTPKAEPSARFDRTFGGILTEFHSCPRCGTTAVREETRQAA